MDLERACKTAKVLIVDDRPDNLLLLKEILALDGYQNLRTTQSPSHAVEEFFSWEPDLLLLDLRMPGMDGFDVMSKINTIPRKVAVPILVLTASTSESDKLRALSMGAKDFLTKPFDPTEVLLRIRNLLETRILHRQLAEENRSLEDRVRERTEELDLARVEVLERLAIAAEFRDDVTGEHTKRVARTSWMVCVEMGIPHPDCELIARASQLHDIGKIGIPDGILLKRGALEVSEFERVKTHTAIGARILGGSDSDLLKTAEVIAMTHHEWWDGTGYPRGLKGKQIPLPGRIVAIADVYDALTHLRPYKQAWTTEEAEVELLRHRGRQFDPEVVDAFLHLTRTTGAIDPDAVISL